MLFQTSALSALGSGVADGCVFGVDSVAGAGSCDAGSGAGAGVSAWAGSLAGAGVSAWAGSLAGASPRQGCQGQ